MIVGDELEWRQSLLLEFQKQRPRLRDGESVLRSLRKNPDEPQFRDCASEDSVICSFPEMQQPKGNPLVEFVFEQPQRDQCVHIAEISPGRLARIA